MASWTDGYFSDVQYTGDFYRQMTPGNLTLACLAQGVRPPPLGPGSVYLELGCGQGFNLNVMAAANPAMRFIGVDFNPAQIANATRLAEEAGLANVTFSDDSFAQMLERADGLYPRCDVIALHGVLSWISPENRAVLVQILDRLLKPGGLVYVSYNCLPGWAPNMPLQRFIFDYVARTTGPRDVEIKNAFRAAEAMAEGKARYFNSSPSVRGLIEQSLKGKPAYLTHEYLNAHFHPFYHADVAAELQAARLAYAASANLLEDILNLAAPEGIREQVKSTHDPVWRQSLLDYGVNKMFRRDIFVRGRNQLPQPEMIEQLGRLRFGLGRVFVGGALEFTVPIGRLQVEPAPYLAMLHALAEGPRSFAELRQLPEMGGLSDGQAIQAVLMLADNGVIYPAQEPGDLEPARRLNRLVLSRAAQPDPPNHVAAPVLGTGLQLAFHELIALRELADGRAEPAAMARTAAEVLERNGAQLQKDGAALEGRAAVEAEFLARIQQFLELKLPVLQAAGVI